jgi:hypothetical protein
MKIYKTNNAYDDDKATRLLERLLNDNAIIYITQKYKLKIKNIYELRPSKLSNCNGLLYGENYKKGQQIGLGLRYIDCFGITWFVPYNFLVLTFLHELCHNVYNAHASGFFKLYKDIRQDYLKESNLSKISKYLFDNEHIYKFYMYSFWFTIKEKYMTKFQKQVKDIEI